MVHILCVGAGAGGGGGATGTAGTARGGGGGGASGGQASLIVPANLLPDALMVVVATGGIGGAAGVQGGSPGSSYVALDYVDDVSQADILVAAADIVTVASGGGPGTTIAGGFAGSSGPTQLAPLATYGFLNTFQCQNGGTGGVQTGAVGSSLALPLTGAVQTAGAGGAGTTSADFAGGGFTAVANSWLSDRRPVTPVSGSNPGAHGHVLRAPFFSFGGCGGSSSNTSVGGRGGNGAYGSGGGGGGGGTTGGRGGDGGPGIVIFTAW